MTTYNDIHSHAVAVAGGISTQTTTSTRVYVDTNVHVAQVHRTYYVCAAGDDGNDGYTFGQEWKTIAAVNAASLVDDDQVLFNRGETFVGQLVPAYSGSLGHDIIFGAYGTGARPIIDGSGDSALELLTYDQNYLRYEHLDFAGSTGASISTVRMWTSYVYFYNCIMRDAGGVSAKGISMSDDGGLGRVHHNTVDSCQLYNNGGDGIYIGVNDAADAETHDNTIKNCLIHNNGVMGSGHGIYADYGTLIEDNTVYDNYREGIKVQEWHTAVNSAIVRNNTVYGNGWSGINLNQNGAIAYNNLIYGNNYQFKFGPAGANCQAYFNTIVNAVATSTTRAIVWTDDAINIGNVFENNIVIQDTAQGVQKGFHEVLSPDLLSVIAANNAIDYNAYYYTGLVGENFCYDAGGNITFAAWQALGADAHSTHLLALPDFVTRYTDLHPADGGNLKAKGLCILGYQLDKDGGTKAEPPTPGCYEDAA